EAITAPLSRSPPLQVSPGGAPMKLGVAWYPEQHPPERWADDVARMAAAGLEVVRLAEFAWTALQPSRDIFEWAWLDRAVDLAAGALRQRRGAEPRLGHHLLVQHLPRVRGGAPAAAHQRRPLPLAAARPPPLLLRPGAGLHRRAARARRPRRPGPPGLHQPAA